MFPEFPVFLYLNDFPIPCLNMNTDQSPEMYCESCLFKVDYTCRISHPVLWFTFLLMQKENMGRVLGLPRSTHTSQSSKRSSSDGLVDRPPMLDISNKLHALVDEFVSNLSSECDNLANNVTAEGHMYVAHDNTQAGRQTQRPSNRTTTEVLNGLKRPSGTPLTSPHTREIKTHVQHPKPGLQTGNNRHREEGVDTRFKKDMKMKSAALQESDDPDRARREYTDIEDILVKEIENRGGSSNHMAQKGRHMHTVEVLSSDSASDDCPRPRAKHSTKRPGTKTATKGRDSAIRGRTRRMRTRSPSRSPESSHCMDYSYEEDTPSLGGTSPHGETTCPKLQWPSDLGGSPEDGGTDQQLDYHDVAVNIDYQPKHGRKEADVDIGLEEDDESNGEDTGRNPIQTESDGDDMPVLPKVPVKRKVTNPPRATERRTQRSTAKSRSPHTKRQRTPQIDASVITQLQFSRRPQNCVSVPNLWLRLWLE